LSNIKCQILDPANNSAGRLTVYLWIANKDFFAFLRIKIMLKWLYNLREIFYEENYRTINSFR
jgi:hypothetical protein